MTDLHFALIREGTSDEGLIAHIRTLLIRAGISSVVGAARPYKGTTKERIATVLAESSAPDLIFVHRDADARDPSPRHQEISAAAEDLGCAESVIAVVPVQELEAWLLTDEAAIREVAGKPRGRTTLNLPGVGRVETTSSPKEVLQTLCLIASETSGARRKKAAAAFNAHRATLLDRFDVDGAVSGLPSWQRFVSDLNAAAARMLAVAVTDAATTTGEFAAEAEP